MNKKRLSVVMAGAMLATSVAPVMAADATEIKTLSKSQLAAYANTIKATMGENKIDASKNLKIYGNSQETGFVSQAVSTKANGFGDTKSVYGVRINGGNIENTIATAIKNIKDATPGAKIEIVKYATTNFHGLLIPGSEIKSIGSNAKYEKDDFDANFDSGLKTLLTSNEYVKSYELSDDKTTLTIILHALDADGKNKTVTVKVGDEKLDLDIPMSGDKILSQVGTDDDIQKCDGFMKLQDWIKSEVVSTPEEVVETVNVVADVDPTLETLNSSELYDGTILTSKGTEIVNDVKNGKGLVKFATANASAITDNANGTYEFVLEYYAKGYPNDVVKSIKVVSNKKNEINALYKILDNTAKGQKSYSVGIVGGANRYATAVNVAKQQGAKLDGTNNKNIVLVNGDALVDGLSAAPLAASLNKGGDAAPILLSKADTLPKETKDYLNKLSEGLTAKQKKDVTVTLVGGETVLTSYVEDELTSMGFKVDRLGGDNREATSLEVAEVVAGNTAKEVFVVGAEGEADAMSISAVAASEKLPIIVAKAGGISKDALKFIEKQENENVTIIGGTSVFSNEDEEKLNETKSDSKTAEAIRIAGANRTETNAKILKEFYTAGIGKGVVKPVVLAKNGMTSGKYELVDALTAANLGGPIVLAKDKLSIEQESAILNANKKGAATHIIQVGEGLNPDVIKSVSKLLGLENPNK